MSADCRRAYVCSRCAGRGRLEQYGQVMNGVCYQCKGTGKQFTRPRAATPKWAVFWLDEQLGQWLRFYSVLAKTKAEALSQAERTRANAAASWKDRHRQVRVIKWTDMASPEAMTWDEATHKEQV